MTKILAEKNWCKKKLGERKSSHYIGCHATVHTSSSFIKNYTKIA